MKRRTLTAGLLWHSVNSHNLGVGALTQANLGIIRRVAARLGTDIEFIIIGWYDDREPYVSGPDITMFPLRPREHLLRPGRLAAVIRRCDVVFDIGYGDSFTDLYGVKRFLYLAASKALVLILRRPLVLSPQTIGPFRRRWVRALAKSVMKRAAAVVTRDNLSSEYLRSLRVVRNSCEATDVAFELPAGPAPLSPSEKMRVGINVSGLLYNGGAEMARRLGLSLNYAALMEKILERFTWMKDCEIHLIGHVFADDPLEDDRRALKHLAASFPEVVVAPDFATPSEAKAYIGAMDFFIGARMHACIAAYSSGVPVVPLAYSRKFSGLFGTLEYDRIADCTADSQAAVLDKVFGGFNERDRLRKEIGAGQNAARRKLKLYESVIAERLGAAAGRRAIQPAVTSQTA